MKNLLPITAVILVCLAAAACVQQTFNPAAVAQPQPSATPAPSATPSANNKGWGEIELNYLHTISSGVFKTSLKHLVFDITWNEQKSIWEAKSDKWVGRGEATLHDSGITCNGSYFANVQMTSGVIVPPNPLKILGDCKLVAQFHNQYEAFPFSCDNGISFTNEATTSIVGPLVFDLRIGSREHASGNPGEEWTSIYEYVITRLKLPPEYLLPYCDTSGVLDSRTKVPTDPLDKILTPRPKP
ncbi:MAG: hypothetical protein HPY45_17305 [Anaerolineae bacterium]|nr:hypothetical protein [Anaerolineae bacterium]